jgi:membrane protein YdbS with pleckstrin-like domain
MVDGETDDRTEKAAEGYRKLNRKCIRSMYIGYGIAYTILLAAFLVLMSYARETLGSAYGTAWLLGIVALALILVYVVAAPPVFYARYWYRITEDKVDVRSGILILRHIMVPIERVHQVEVTRGPIDNMLGLGHVNITTAGGTAKISYLEIDEAERIADRLNELVGTILRERE